MRFLAALPTVVLLAPVALSFAQAAKTIQLRVRLELVLSNFEGDRKVSDEPLVLVLPFNQSDVLRITTPVSTFGPDVVPPCLPPLPQGPLPQGVGKEIDSLVSPLPDGRFSIQMSIRQRSVAGCRTVGDVNTPVFSNRIVARSVTLRDGETTSIFFVDKAANTSSRLTVKLTVAEKP